jgi:hypothetical protein
MNSLDIIGKPVDWKARSLSHYMWVLGFNSKT